MINLQLDKMRINPYPTFTLMRENNPACQVEPGGLWALTRYDNVESALKEHHLFSSTGIKSIVIPDWLSPDCRRDLFVTSEDPPIHTQRRSLINKAFIPEVINALIPMMRETAKTLLTQISTKSSADFVNDFSYPFTNRVINSIIGIEDKQKVDDVQQWIQTIEKLTVIRPSDARIQELEVAIRRQVKTLTEVIQDRRKNPRNDLVTQLVNTTSKDFMLTDDMLINILDIFIRAGYITTVHLLGCTVLQLSKRPDLVKLLQSNPEKIPHLVEEVLRLYTPSLCTLRQTTQPIKMHGVTIPENSRVLLYMAAANRDPGKFPNPDDIDLSRNNIKDHLAFGSGPHVCIGLALARLELKIAVETLLDNFNHIECPDVSKLDWSYSIFVRGLNSLPIRLSQ